MRKLANNALSRFLIYDNRLPLVSWLAILGYWLLIAGVTLRILMKRRAVPSAMAAVDYLHSAVSQVIAYLAVGELHLGKRRAE